MRASRWFILASLFVALAAASSRAANEQQALPPAAAAKETAPPPATKEPVPPPSVTVIAPREAHGVLGREVRSPADEDMGRIVDIVVDRTGTVRAAVIDFGGFLGVGSRKIVVDWNVLRFGGVSDTSDAVTREITQDQVKAAPEYKEDTPIVVLGAAGNLSPLDEEH